MARSISALSCWVAGSIALAGVGCAAEGISTFTPGDAGFEHAAGGSGGSGDGAAGTADLDGGAAGYGGSGGGSCQFVNDCGYLNSGCAVGVCNAQHHCEAHFGPDGTSCDDDKCTVGGVCQAGQCVGAKPKDCSPLDGPCTLGVCDATTGLCNATEKLDGTPCDDDSPCTTGDGCSGGICVGGDPKDCSALDGSCVAGVCNPMSGQCEAKPETGSHCDDGDPCTQLDTCQSGQCIAGTPKDCSSLAGPCVDGVCDALTGACTTEPRNEGAACDDGNGCTTGETCTSGKCAAGTPVLDGTACDDGSTCTSDDVCTAGTCKGSSGTTPIYFQESFANDAAGWTMDAEWQIGPAKASTCASFGNDDPAEDHSSTSDDGIAGVVIGGCADQTTHGFRYLTSPVIDTSTAAGPVVLGFWRVLNTDYDPYMHNRVEVYDGTAWKTVWAIGTSTEVDAEAQDATWKFVSYDLTKYKNANLRVRFGFDIGSGGVFSVGSWNLDDVVVGETACP